MDSVSTNPYEQQLYTVFKSFDVDNEEALDKVAVLDLCDALQLEDRGVSLANTLFERKPDRVTFEQFRNGLLSVLSGGERSGETTSASACAAPVPSDEDSGREVAPKFIFGSKKYGRRSRPQRLLLGTSGPPRASSVSRLDADEKRHRLAQRARYRRSASAMESRDIGSTSDEDNASVDLDDTGSCDLDHDRRINCERALALCRDLHMEGIDQTVVEQIFENVDSDETTVGEFFDRLNTSLTTSIEGAQGLVVPTIDDVDEDGVIASETIVEEWERAGVSRPRRLLLRLGFVAPVVPLLDLEAALNPGTVSAVAALVVVRLRLARARGRADRAMAERDRLRADLAAAERRVQLLAADIDDVQARNEARLEERARRAEARHADSAKRAAAEAVAERERAADLAARLDEEVARRVEFEARVRAELDAERTRGTQLEERLVAAEERANAAERLAAMRAAEARLASEPPAQVPNAEEMELRSALAAASAELRRLRDREDELSAALSRTVPASLPHNQSPCEDLSEELRSLLDPVADLPPVLEDCNPSAAMSLRNINVKEVVSRVQSISEITDKFSEKCEICNNEITGIKTQVHKLVELLSHLKYQDAEIQTDQLEDGVALGDINYDEDRQKYLEIIRELEESLELMRDEYERCEEYWTRKLQEERNVQETERRASDERLAALLRRVTDCERRFTLPPIPERDALEAQVAALEREHAEQLAALRREHSAQLAAARQRDPRPRPRPCSCAESTAALVGRAARADAALRRLGARLRAADALVADLYIENCRLQHRAPPP